MTIDPDRRRDTRVLRLNHFTILQTLGLTRARVRLHEDQQEAGLHEARAKGDQERQLVSAKGVAQIADKCGTKHEDERRIAE